MEPWVVMHYRSSQCEFSFQKDAPSDPDREHLYKLHPMRLQEVCAGHKLRPVLE